MVVDPRYSLAVCTLVVTTLPEGREDPQERLVSTWYWGTLIYTLMYTLLYTLMYTLLYTLMYTLLFFTLLLYTLQKSTQCNGLCYLMHYEWVGGLC